MSLFSFLLQAVSISLSGVIAPGPVTAVTVGKGADSIHAGAWIAIGHGIVEFPLMILIFYGLGHLLGLHYVRSVIFAVGGLFLLVMGASMFRSLKQSETTSVKSVNSPTMAGAILSLGNPYLLVWWATVGAALISRSVTFGVLGFSAFAIAHWCCDFLWYYFLSVLSHKGGIAFGKGFQKALLVVCGTVLLFFGGKFIFDAARAVF
jgi:threonine/homoserine/homoserine lactone efflux protein